VSITVVLADDHAIVCDGLRFLLEAQRDLNVVGIAHNGHDAVRLAAELRPDVVITDVEMPGLNGIEATRRIREVSPATRVIVLSMYGAQEHILRALQAGARGYLLKESAGEEVVKAVRAAMSGVRYLSREISDKVVDAFVQDAALSEEDRLARLSEREREVLQLVVEGKSSPEIAALLCLSAKTVDTYRSRLMHKLEINDLPGLVKFAIRNGLISLR